MIKAALADWQEENIFLALDTSLFWECYCLIILNFCILFYFISNRFISRKIDLNFSNYPVFESAYGRTKKRHYYVVNNVSKIVNKKQKWSNLNSVFCVENLRQLKNGKSQLSSRYFITNLSQDGEQLTDYIRGH